MFYWRTCAGEREQTKEAKYDIYMGIYIQNIYVYFKDEKKKKTVCLPGGWLAGWLRNLSIFADSNSRDKTVLPQSVPWKYIYSFLYTYM